MRDQAAGLRRIAISVAPADPPPRRRTIAVTGGKGGIGKSTVAVNLAVAYAQRGARTVALDGDLGMADLNLLLGLAPGKTALDVIDGTYLPDALVAAHGIHLLPAQNASFRLANLDADSRSLLLAGLADLGDRFDTLVVDTPAGIGDNAIALAGAATDIVIVANPEPLSLADAYACIKVLALREHVRRAFVLPNNVRSPSEAEHAFVRLAALVERFLAVTLVRLPAIPHDPMIALAAAAGVPLVIFSPDSPASRALCQAARRLDALAQTDNRNTALRRFLEASPAANQEQP